MLVASFHLPAEANQQASAPPPRVLIINSYELGYSWSDDELAGVISVLDQNFDTWEKNIEFLNLRRFSPTDLETQLREEFKIKYSNAKIDLIITLDNYAFEFYLRYRDLFPESSPLVFGGLNNADLGELSVLKNVTGVIEALDFAANIDLILTLHPNTKEILLITDLGNTNSYVEYLNDRGLRHSRKALNNAINQYSSRVNIRVIERWTLEDILLVLKNLSTDIPVLISTFGIDANNQLVAETLANRQALNDAANSPLYSPSASLQTLAVSPGRNLDQQPWLLTGGRIITGKKHGQAVGEIAARVLKGEDASSIPIQQHSPTNTVLSYPHLKRFKVDPKLIPADAMLYNQPITFYSIHRSRIIGAIALFVVLGAVIVYLVLNILRRRNAEAALVRLAAAVEQSSNMIALLDLQGNITYFNAAFQDITDHNMSAALGLPFDFYCLRDADRTNFSEIQKIIDEKGYWEQNIRGKRGDEFSFLLKTNISPIRNPNTENTAYVMVATDITHEQKMEEQLRFNDKMRAIGLLAGGVAHDFNNLLQIISGNASLAMAPKIDDADRYEHLIDIQQATEKAAELTKQLLVFGRRQPATEEHIDLNKLISTLIKMLTRLLGAHVEVQVFAGHSLWLIRAAKGQIEQVLVNLCLNARDSMPQGGQLSIHTENVSLSKEFCDKQPWARPGRFVCITVTDSGEGMDQNTVNHIFEPFFSTKPHDKGTGLGLAVVYGIVRDHDGLIHVDSKPQKGTQFRVYFPASEGNISQVMQPEHKQTTKGAGTILLAEDEVAVRKFSAAVLSEAGYDVLVADDGVEAIKVFDANRSHIDLVVLDAIMPRMTGKDVLDHISKVAPGTLVLFCSGYSADVLHPAFALGEGVQILQKPFSPEALLETAHSLITLKKNPH